MIKFKEKYGITDAHYLCDSAIFDKEKVKVGEFWHSAYQGKQLEYDTVYAELRKEYDKNEELKQQLAEKDKELHCKNCECEKWKVNYENCSKLEKIMTKEHQYCLDNWRASEQDKIEFAVEQLEKVKEYADIDFRKNCYINAVELDKFIDNQIEELKKE